MCSVWAIWIGPGPRIYSTDRHGTGTAQAQHAGTGPLGPLDAGLRRFEFTAMGRVERAIASADCSFRQAILTVAILARQRQERPSAIRAGRRRCEVRSHLSPHRAELHRTASHCIASRRTAPRGQERAWQGEVRSRTTAAAAAAAGR